MRFGQWWLAACLVLPAWAWAQAAPQVLTLAQALQVARENVDVSLARRALASARADVVAADHAPIPVVIAKASQLDLANGIGSGSVLGSKRIDKSLGVDWTYERGNKRELRTRAAEGVAGAAQHDVADVVVQQQIAVASAYFDLLAAQERVEQVGAMERGAAELAGASQRRQRAGDISLQESLRTEIEARRAQTELRGAQADRQRAALTLAQLLGLQGELQVEPAWPPLVAEQPGLPDIEQRADVLAARRRVEAAQAAFDAAAALRRNDLTLGASLDHFPGTSSRLLELRVSVPLGGMLGAYGYDGEIARARATLDSTQDQLEKVRRQARAESGRLAEDLRSAAARAAEFEQAIVPRARQVAGMAELAYSRGALPLVDLLDARRTLRSVLLDDLAARADFARASTAWQLRQQPPTP
ncbi:MULTISPECIES: TolC family protein [Ramlibacter]|uniref:TolC family protein n=1 Tax=Ramlibacter pinisoli TaxID=2682844 RepID=A0A6N8IWX1_9BURK|nr:MULTISPECIES: TolC family protein [Ramlibacter]MBA2965624.1 TolC family protein [Ramlibacter sp. CGMCC 1.13660]MVQ30590.1 TolC family protein [Ramlibacter pinisoli]